MTSYRTVEIRIGRVKIVRVVTPVEPVIDDLPLTRTEAAAFLGMTPDHLSRLTAAGDVPSHRLGNRPRYFRDELAAWLREKRGVAA